MSLVKFVKGLYASYNTNTHADAIYFATDTGVIYVNGVAYGAKMTSEEVNDMIGRTVEDVTLLGNVLTITYTKGAPKTVDLTVAFSNATQEADGMMSMQDKKNLDALAKLLNDAGVVELSTNYESSIEDTTLEMPNAVGGINKGTTVAELNGKSYNQLFDDLLFPTVNPTGSGPTVSGFALNPSATTVELGTAVASISEPTLNKGSWSAYNSGKTYTGDVTGITYNFKINGNTVDTIAGLEGLTYTVLGNHTYNATIAYADGPIPVNNKGVEVPLLQKKANSIPATQRTVNVTAPWYASTATAGVLTKQSLVAWNTTAGAMQAGANGTGFEVKPHTADAPQMFKIPRVATNLQMYNSVAKAFETVSLSDWTRTDAVEQVNGIDQNYYTYTYSGANRGAVKLIVKF